MGIEGQGQPEPKEGDTTHVGKECAAEIPPGVFVEPMDPKETAERIAAALTNMVESLEGLEPPDS